MCNNQFYPKGLSPLKQGPGVVERLARLRREIEAGAASICDVEVPVVLLLSDVCEALGLGTSERRKVLGREGARRVKGWLDTPVQLNGKSASRKQ